MNSTNVFLFMFAVQFLPAYLTDFTIICSVVKTAGSSAQNQQVLQLLFGNHIGILIQITVSIGTW